MKELIRQLEDGNALSAGDLARLIALTDAEACRELREAAYRVKCRTVGKKVYLRGLIEYSNICTRNCLYCGIRRDNTSVRRFVLSETEILAGCQLAHDYGYGSVVIQGGERSDRQGTDFICGIVGRIRERFPQLGITLSCGEQSIDVYRQWKQAGADRYLLRIESSNETLFKQIHPQENNYHSRIQALHDLRTAGFQVGTGVMIGLPGQTAMHLAEDVLFFRKMDVDMIGMGPWLPQQEAPLHDVVPETPERAEQRFDLALNMVAVVRLMLPDVNIASTTALQAIRPADGRERGLLAGANVIMPNVCGTEHRRDYQLYDGKPGMDENALEIRRALDRSISSIGESIAYNVQGTPLHYTRRCHSSSV